MKIINEKGKLFGVVNIIDLLVILLIVLIAVGAAYKTSNDEGSSSEKIEYTVLLQCVRPDPAKSIHIGDKLVAKNNYTTAAITGVKSTPGLLVSTTDEGKRVMVNDPYLVDVLITIQDQAVVSSANIEAGGQELRVGKKYYVKSLDYEFEGVVQTIKFLYKKE